MREQHLTAVGNAHDACSAVHGTAEEIAVPALIDPCMHAATHQKRQAFRSLLVREQLLKSYRGVHRIERIVKGRVHAVARHLHDGALVSFDCSSQDRVVACQRQAHALGFLLPQAGAALDVGEQIGCDCGRYLHAEPFKRATDRYSKSATRGTPVPPLLQVR